MRPKLLIALARASQRGSCGRDPSVDQMGSNKVLQLDRPTLHDTARLPCKALQIITSEIVREYQALQQQVYIGM